MYSTRNLIVNGGFSRLPPDRPFGWEITNGETFGPSWRRVAVPTADRNGLPHSAYAAALDATNAPADARLSQEIPIREVPTRRFAVRLTARGSMPQASATLIVAVRNTNGADEQVVCRHPLRLSPQWQRSRAEFDVPETASWLRIEIAMEPSDRAGDAVTITDMRLIGLLRAVDDIAIRFDPCSDMLRASSRLRAFILEDYLNLLGCRTSINRGGAFDLYVCQKTQPWLGLLMARLARKTVIFDLDDNDLLISRWRAANVRGFVRAADRVSVGSEFLRELVGDWNPRTFLLENPVDILDPDVTRGNRGWDGRLVWFGMPENLWMLDRLDLGRPVTTITRGGSVEYGLKTVDEHLIASDLALLPVFLNDETRAKNANRLVKCVGLGLPFLASDTQENRRALQALRLPDECLVASESDWPARIDEVGRDYDHYRKLIGEARPRAFDIYGVERIAADWLNFCTGLVRGKPSGAPRPYP